MDHGRSASRIRRAFSKADSETNVVDFSAYGYFLVFNVLASVLVKTRGLEDEGLFEERSSTANSGDCGPSPGPAPVAKTGVKVDYQVAGPAEMRTSNLHRAIGCEPGPPRHRGA
jgi:hypothetical protein